MNLHIGLFLFLLTVQPAVAQINTGYVDPLPINARAVGMGLNEATAVSVDNALAANPGMLGFLKGIQILHNQYEFSDPRRLYAFSYNRARIGTFAIGYDRWRNRTVSPLEGVSEEKRNNFSVGFGATLLNTFGVGLAAHSVNGIWEAHGNFPPHDKKEQDIYLNIGLLLKTPILRFRTDYLDDELNIGAALNAIDRESESLNRDWDTWRRLGISYELAPVMYLPAFNSQFHPLRFVVAYERKTSPPDYVIVSDSQQTVELADDGKTSTGWGIELGFGEVFTYRKGRYTDQTDHKTDTEGYGIQIPLNILTGDAWPMRLQYDWAHFGGANHTYHSIKVDLQLSGKLAFFD